MKFTLPGQATTSITHRIGCGDSRPVARRMLFRSIVERFVEGGVRAEDILISVIENGFEDW